MGRAIPAQGNALGIGIHSFMSPVGAAHLHVFGRPYRAFDNEFRLPRALPWAGIGPPRWGSRKPSSSIWNTKETTLEKVEVRKRSNSST